MKKQIVSFAATVVLVLPSQAQDPPPDFYGDYLKESFGFWKNNGQVLDTDDDARPDIQYYSEGSTPAIFIRRSASLSLVLAYRDTTVGTPDTLHRLDISFSGENFLAPDASATVIKGSHKNFYLPHCGSGITHVPGYNRIVYPGIYPDIDMHLYCGSRGQKMAIVIRPGGDPNDVRLVLSGQDHMELDVFGNLRILLADKWIVLPEAVAYQYDQNNTITPVNWTAEYVPNNNTGQVGFTFSTYDTNKPLVLLIGPPPFFGGGEPYTDGVCWSTYFGGTGHDNAYAQAIGNDGNHYLAGQTQSPYQDFPHTEGTVYFESIQSLFLAAFNSTDELTWTDYFGGTSQYQQCSSVAVRTGVDPKIFVGGSTDAMDIPWVDDGTAYIDNSAPNTFTNGLLARFEVVDGLMEWFTYFGNNGVSVNNVTIDASGRLLAVGSTNGELPQHQVPLPPGAEQWPFHNNNPDGWVALFNLDEQILWSTYIGGSEWDDAMNVRSWGSKIIVSGQTYSPSIDNLNPGNGAYWRPSHPVGDQDLYIKEFDLNGDQLWGTFVGGSGYDGAGAHGLDICELTRDVFLVGATMSDDLDIVPGDGWYDDSFGGGTDIPDGFVYQFDGADRNDEWVSYVGGDGNVNDVLHTVTTAKNGRIFLGGSSYSDGFPYEPIVGLYNESTRFGNSDAVIMYFTPNHGLAWSTYFGGDDLAFGENIIQLALEEEGQKLYACGTTDTDYNPDLDIFFPLTNPQNGAWFDQDYDEPRDGFISAFCLEGVVTGVTAASEGLPDARIFSGGPGSLTISGLASGTHRITLFDPLGRTVFAQRFTSGTASPVVIPVLQLASGSYIARIDEGQSVPVVIAH